MKHLLLVLLLLLVSCHLTTKPTTYPAFTPPRLPQAATDAAPQQASCIQGVFPRVVGRFSFAEGAPKPDSARETDYFWEGAALRAERDSTHLGTDGLEIVTDYGQAVSYQRPGLRPDDPRNRPQLVYPVWVVNATAHTKLLLGKDSWVFAIQEAKDRNGDWRPIESKGGDFCGNGRWGLRLHPHQALGFVMARYAGSFHTILRVRLLNGESRYLSAPYAGQIDEQQFRVPANEYKYLRQDPAAYATYTRAWYYGAEPAVVDSLKEQRNQ